MQIFILNAARAKYSHKLGYFAHANATETRLLYALVETIQLRTIMCCFRFVEGHSMRDRTPRITLQKCASLPLQLLKTINKAGLRIAEKCC